MIRALIHIRRSTQLTFIIIFIVVLIISAPHTLGGGLEPVNQAATQSIPSSPFTEFEATVNSALTVNLRSGAGLNFGVIQGVAPNAVVTVIGVSRDDLWYNIRLENGNEGWASASFIDPLPPSTDVTEAETTSEPQSTNEVATQTNIAPTEEQTSASTTVAATDESASIDNSAPQDENLGQPPTELVIFPSEQNVNVLSQVGVVDFTFQELGQPNETVLPNSASSFTINMPYAWQLMSGNQRSYIDLHYDLVYQGPQDVLQDPTLAIEPSEISIYINNVLAASFNQTLAENQLLHIPIPDGAITEPGKTITIQYTLQTAGVCDNLSYETNLILYNDSVFHMDFDVIAPEVTLADFPRPLLLGSFLPETVLIVIPDDFNEADLTAAAAVGWAVGTRSNSIILQMLTASQAMDMDIQNISTIIIGTPENNAFLMKLYQQNLLPTSLGSQNELITSDGMGIMEADGVLQIITSPDNPNIFYFVITGQTDEGIIKASNALVGDFASYIFSSNLAIISDVVPTNSLQQNPIEFQNVLPLSDLGFSNIDITGLGTARYSHTFFIPGNRQLADNPILHLEYAHSPQIDPAGSTILIEINGEVAGTAPIDVNTQGDKQIDIVLPKDYFKMGVDNRLTITLVTSSTGSCVPPDTATAWIKIQETSQLQMPLTTATEEVMPTFDDPLSHLFQTLQDAKIVLVLPNRMIWAEYGRVAQIAQIIGDEHQRVSSKLEIIFADDFSPEEYKDYHIILVGEPSANDVIALINDDLPQPFFDDGSALEQKFGGVVYRLPSDFGVGLVEVIPSPWNAARGITVITGTTQESALWALDAIISPDLRPSLANDINYIRYENVVSIDSRTLDPKRFEDTAGEIVTFNITPTVISETSTVSAFTSTDTPEILETPTPLAQLITIEPTITLTPSPTLSPTPVFYDELPESYKPLKLVTPSTLNLGFYIAIGIGVALLGLGILYRITKFVRNRFR